jgi:hypothetical protein
MVFRIFNKKIVTIAYFIFNFFLESIDKNDIEI